VGDQRATPAAVLIVIGRHADAMMSVSQACCWFTSRRGLQLAGVNCQLQWHTARLWPKSRISPALWRGHNAELLLASIPWDVRPRAGLTVLIQAHFFGERLYPVKEVRVT